LLRGKCNNCLSPEVFIADFGSSNNIIDLLYPDTVDQNICNRAQSQVDCHVLEIER